MKNSSSKIIFICVCTFSFLTEAQNIYTFAGNGISGYSGDGGNAVFAQMNGPISVVRDGLGNLYISEISGKRIRKINSSGTISTFAGTGTAGFSGDGSAANLAQLNFPYGVASDPSGNIYVCDEQNHRIRKINVTGTITTIAGTGVQSFSGDGGLAISAQLNTPHGVAVDLAGNIYFSDSMNGRIRKISTTGTITTVAGTGIGGFSGDGGNAISAQINSVNYVAVDASGNIYISDSGNHRIRKINTSNIINTICGTGINGFSGDGGSAISAQLNNPQGIAIDAIGNIYISDDGNQRIRMINTSGVINSIAGTGLSGFSGDGGAATLAKISCPTGITVDGSGNVFFVDACNVRVRIICTNNCPIGTNINQVTVAENKFSLYPNPTSNFLQITEGNFENSQIEIINYLGQTVQKFPYSNKIEVSTLPQGIYNLKIISPQQTLYSKFIKE